MVNKLCIHTKNVTLEVIARIINVVAKKYGCRVTYLPAGNTLRFVGDPTVWQWIVEEFMETFLQANGMQPVKVPIRDKKRDRFTGRI